MKKIAALKKKVIRELLPYLTEIGNPPIEKIRVVKKIGPSNLRLWLSMLRGGKGGEKALKQILWETRGLREGKAITVAKRPAVEQLSTLVHESLHTPRSRQFEALRLAEKASKRKAIPPRIIEALGYKEKDFYKHVFPRYYSQLALTSEEKGIRTVTKVQTLRLLRTLKQKNPALFEKVKRQILKEERARNLQEALKKRSLVGEWDKAVARHYRGW